MLTENEQEAVGRLKRTWAAIVADGYGTNTTLATVLTALERETARADRAEAAFDYYKAKVEKRKGENEDD